MIRPSVTALCCTYGRTSLLEESIESFLRQDYEGEKHLVIVNDLKEQQLTWSGCPPNVQIVNLDVRLPNLGAKRNLAALFAQTELILSWSDDDIHLPNRISDNVAVYGPGKYVKESGRWYFFSRSGMEIHSKGLFGPFMMARADYWRLGGIPDADVGEDRKFLAKVERALTVVQSAAPSYVYRWITGRYHISGHGFDNHAWEKVASQVRATLDSGEEPSGRVELRPQWRVDYCTLAEAARERDKTLQ